jgi:hypothetical protein
MSHQHNTSRVHQGNVFDEIWKADKRAVKPFHESRFPNQHHGKFVVKVCDAPRRNRNTRDHKLFQLHKWNGTKYVPAQSIELLQDGDFLSYGLVHALFDNYESDETKPEVNTKQECEEILTFLNCVVDSEPIKVAASYLRNKYSKSSELEQEDTESFSNRIKFRNKLKKIWFDQFDWRDSKSLSGYVHL